jgi:3-deoxy-D-manno-octulosonic acid kinase
VGGEVLSVSLKEKRNETVPAGGNRVELLEEEFGAWRILLNSDFSNELTAQRFTESCDELWCLAQQQDATIQPEHELAIGRGIVLMKQLPSERRLVIRLCRRGGMIRYLNRYAFAVNPLRSGKSVRPFAELEILAQLRREGLSVPTPVAAGVLRTLGGTSFRGFVATEEVPVAENLLQLIRDMRGHPGSMAAARELCRQAGVQAARMLAVGVFHADLHVGNVLVTAEDQIFLIDFDKAIRFKPSEKAKYCDLLMRRWKKSVRKHRVRFPDVLLAAEQGFLQGLQEE